MIKHSGPNPELLAKYGTDEFYYRNLEKRAADTEYLAPMLQTMSRGGWGRLVVDADRRYQGKIDSQRLQAEALNMKFRRLEGTRFSESRENLGGAGTQRSRYQRQMLAQPYMIHPMYADRAMPMMTRMASVAERVGKKMAKEAAGPDDPHAFYDPGGLASAEFRAQSQLAQAAGRGALGGLEEVVGRPGVAVGEKVLGAADTFGDASQAVGEGIIGGTKAVGGGIKSVAGGLMAAGGGALAAAYALRNAGQATKEKLKHLWRSTPLFTPLIIPQKILSSVGRGAERFMSTDIQSTPRWGTGVHVPTNVNEYGIAVGGARLGA